MCAGRGDDVLTVARRHRRGGDLAGRLVEASPENAAAARATIDRYGIRGIDVVEADAGTSDAYAGAVPADLVLACGVFGNISDEDVRATVERLPMLCAPGAHVIWTRHPREDDIVTTIEGWFAAVGFEPLALVVPRRAIFGVGAARYSGPGERFRPGARLFTFGSGRPHA
jgi:hypothetical protein